MSPERDEEGAVNSILKDANSSVSANDDVSGEVRVVAFSALILLNAPSFLFAMEWPFFLWGFSLFFAWCRLVVF